VPAPVFLCVNRAQATGNPPTFWIPACVGMTMRHTGFLSPGQADAWTASPARGEASGFMRLKCDIFEYCGEAFPRSCPILALGFHGSRLASAGQGHYTRQEMPEEKVSVQEDQLEWRGNVHGIFSGRNFL